VLDPKTEKAIAQIAEQIREVFGAELVSLVLYGSAAGDDFAPGRSDLNFALVLQQVTFARLKALHQHLPAWRKLGAAMPLLLDRRFLDRARDVFPTEFLDIKAQHRILYGEEVFATLRIDPRHLRYQSEHEARSKLLRLRALYAEVGAERTRLSALMIDSVKSFLIIMRNVVRLRGEAGHSRYMDVLDEFERHAGVSFPTMRQLLRVKLGLEPDVSALDDTFAAYLGEVERLVDLIDRNLPESARHPID
jgi:predicted nucleotidyltransferase